MTGPLAAERAAAQAQIAALTAALTAELDAVVDASRGSNADDEHDPEGTTIAFERQQPAALPGSARRRPADVEVALARQVAGTYGVCESCGRSIGPGRLEARPAARACIDRAR